MDANAFDRLDRRLLDAFQRGFPLTPEPYREIARVLDVDEETVMARLRRLQRTGAVSRIGGVVAPQRVGWSTLAAMAVPPERLAVVADLVSGYAAVNHNYEREHRLNLWFVVTGPDAAAVGDVLLEIEARTGLAVLDLPMLEAYRLDLGFPLLWA
ncbi:MAG: Lrp/AsnC family transcriptional regulator [Alphaproteobacteria bacterium]|nr:Lrp/AsnC family transcriptional regulator [Alphaproteobacteria bacterium]